MYESEISDKKSKQIMRNFTHMNIYNSKGTATRTPEALTKRAKRPENATAIFIYNCLKSSNEEKGMRSSSFEDEEAPSRPGPKSPSCSCRTLC